MSLTVHGVATVTKQEFRLRLRAGRWRWLLGAWFLVLLAFTALLTFSVDAMVDPQDGVGAPEDSGAIVFGGLMLFLLALALLVVPALTAQSVNGDRERGTLATLQVTLLTPLEIAVGKLVAAWVTALVFVFAALPCVAWAVAQGGVPAGRLVVTLGTVVVVLGVVCAVGLGLSALLARSTTSSLLTYLAVFALSVGTLVAFGLGTALTTETTTVTQRQPVWDDPEEQFQGAPDRFESHRVRTERARPDRVWWLLAPNPFVVLADAAPRSEAADAPNDTAASLDPLGQIGGAVRGLRLAPQEPVYGTTDVRDGPPIWPAGLAANVALGVLAVTVTERRLRTPSRRLARGVRVA